MKLEASAFVADPQLIEALRSHADLLDCSSDRVLFRQDDSPTGLFIVHGGEVILTMRSQCGQEILNMPASPGSLLGLPGLIGNVGYTLTATAIKKAEVSFVSKEKFARLMLTEPNVSVMILRVLAAEVRSARMALTAA